MGMAMLTLIGVLAAVATAYWVLTAGIGGGMGGGRGGRPAPPNATLRAVARQLLQPGKGILAADESPKTLGKRLQPGIRNSDDLRRRWRRTLLTSEGLEEHISGVILHAETFGQLSEELAAAASRGLALGIKLDEGTVPLKPKKAGETVTKGLEGLAERCAAFRDAGASFAKWRAVFRVGPHTPSGNAVRRNAEQLAEFAGVAQRCGLVPIIEPEVLAEGNHSLQRGAAAAARVLKGVYRALRQRGDVDPGALLLKVAMVTPGRQAPLPAASPEEIANATLRMLVSTVPRVVPGIVFLSGGQSEAEATANLLALAQLARQRAGIVETKAASAAGADGDPAAAGPRRKRRRAAATAGTEGGASATGDAAGDGDGAPGSSAAGARQRRKQERRRPTDSGENADGSGPPRKAGKPLPWSLSFSFGRALQASALEAWQAGDEAGAQAALLERARANAAAQQGRQP